MASNTAPTYYFTDINFNDSFYISPSSLPALGYYKQYFISKINNDATTGNTITFSDVTKYKDAIKIYSPSGSSPLITFRNQTATSNYGTLQLNSSELTMTVTPYFKIDSGFKIRNNTSGYIALNTTTDTLATIVDKVIHNFTINPTRTTIQKGFNYINTTPQHSGNISAGTSHVYGTANGIQLSAGLYMLCANCLICGLSNANGTINLFSAGYTVGPNFSPIQNTLSVIYSISNPVKFNGLNFNFGYMFTSIVQVPTNNYYLHPYTTVTLPINMATGTIRHGVSSYSFCRIG